MDPKAQRTLQLAAQAFNRLGHTKAAAQTPTGWGAPPMALGKTIGSNALQAATNPMWGPKKIWEGVRNSTNDLAGRAGGWLTERALNSPSSGGSAAGFTSAFGDAYGQYKQRGFSGILQMILDLITNRKQFGQQSALGNLQGRVNNASNPFSRWFYQQTLNNRSQAYGAPKSLFS